MSDRREGEGTISAQLQFDRERWTAEHALRERELALKAQEQARLQADYEFRSAESRRARWSSPLVLAIIAATLAALGNAGVSWLNGMAQRSLEAERASTAQILQDKNSTSERAIEELRADAARILEVIKTNDPDKAAVNLKFLIDAGLISNKNTSNSILSYLNNRQLGEGPSLPAAVQIDQLPTECPFEITTLTIKEILHKFEGFPPSDKEISDIDSQIRALVHVNLSDNQMKSLISLVYNAGISSFKKSRIVLLLNANDFVGAANEILLWNRRGLSDSYGLRVRRLCEHALFSSDRPIMP